MAVLIQRCTFLLLATLCLTGCGAWPASLDAHASRVADDHVFVYVFATPSRPYSAEDEANVSAVVVSPPLGQAAYLVDYQRLPDGRWRPVRLTAADPTRNVWPNLGDDDDLHNAAFLPDVSSRAIDPAWRRAVHNAAALAEASAAGATRPSDSPCSVVVTADQQWVVVLPPGGRDDKFVFAGRPVDRIDGFVAFGRSAPDGRAFSLRQFGQPESGYVDPQLAFATGPGGRLEVLVRELTGQLTVVRPFEGQRFTRYFDTSQWRPTDGIVRGITVGPEGPNGVDSSTFQIVDWDYARDRTVSQAGDVTGLFRLTAGGGQFTPERTGDLPTDH